jgi:hypothetical protein
MYPFHSFSMTNIEFGAFTFKVEKVKSETAGSSKMLVNTYKTTQCHNLDALLLGNTLSKCLLCVT